jgi:GNAT superfamily N-acetyltransferase
VTSLRFAGLGDVAWVAVAITEPGQPIVGAARYVRDPAAGTSAGASVAVASRLRGQGLGRLLLETLMLVALESGVVRLVARVQEENAAGVRLLRGLGAKVTQRGSGFLEYELPVGWGERTLASSSGFRAPRPEQLRAGREP